MEITVKVTYKNGKLKNMRIAAGMSQTELAAAAEINLRMLQYYEQGRKDINVARLATLLKICHALKCDICDILTDEETIALLERYAAERE